MRLGVNVRNMGPLSTRELILDGARAAESAGLDSLWVNDHIAIPPDDAETSGGRYLDPLATLAFIAAATERIRLGTAVLILPYRPPLPTAKWVATVQELSGGRLLLGVGVGWMEEEFKALGVDRGRRGELTDHTLELLRRCFDAGDDDLVEINGQSFLFRPRPQRPPIYIGGAPPHALQRTVRFGDGWLPMGADPEKLRPAMRELRQLAERKGQPRPEVVAMGRLPLEDPTAAGERLAELEELGVDELVALLRPKDGASYTAGVEAIARLRG